MRIRSSTLAGGMQLIHLFGFYPVQHSSSFLVPLPCVGIPTSPTELTRPTRKSDRVPIHNHMQAQAECIKLFPSLIVF